MKTSSLSVIQILFSDQQTMVASKPNGPGGGFRGNRAPPMRAPPKQGIKAEEAKKSPFGAKFG